MDRVRGPLKYLAVVLPLGAMISAFWTGPFYLRHGYMTDMGWEKLTTYSDSLFSRSHLAAQLSDRPGIQYLLMLAAVGALMAFAYRRRGAIFWVVMAAVGSHRLPVRAAEPPLERAAAALLLPGRLPGRCDRHRRAGSHDRDASSPPTCAARPGWCSGSPPAPGSASGSSSSPCRLHTMPLGHLEKDGVTYRWGPFTTKDSSFISSWASWNFTGYEGKPSYPEYYAVVHTMAGIGQQHGCGRAMWEYSDQLNNYGTPMALMLLPFWTNGCIGSMEGLYFEASATTPYHFLDQSELSTSPSDAERGLPYRSTPLNQQDFDLGVQHLQMLGVRYYMASTADDHQLRADQQLAHPHRDERPLGDLPGVRLVDGRARSRTGPRWSTAPRPPARPG